MREGMRVDPFELGFMNELDLRFCGEKKAARISYENNNKLSSIYTLSCIDRMDFLRSVSHLCVIQPPSLNATNHAILMHVMAKIAQLQL